MISLWLLLGGRAVSAAVVCTRPARAHAARRGRQQVLEDGVCTVELDLGAFGFVPASPTPNKKSVTSSSRNQSYIQDASRKPAAGVRSAVAMRESSHKLVEQVNHFAWKSVSLVANARAHAGLRWLFEVLRGRTGGRSEPRVRPSAVRSCTCLVQSAIGYLNQP